jgi:hypothetical protein
MWKIDPKDKHVQKTNMIIYKLIHVSNSGTALWNLGKEGKEKRISNIAKHNICEGRGYKDVY